MKRIVKTAWPLLLAVLLCGPSWADMFVWKDAQGVKHYGDAPPQVLEDQNSLEVRRAYRRQLETRQQEAVAAKVSRRSDFFTGGGAPNGTRPADGARVVMFSAPGCGYCVKAREYFNQNGVAFEELDVSASEDARRRFQDLGGRGVPLILIGDRQISGFDPQAIQAALAKEGGR
ncbi:MAG: glutaredoxin domain-containing protein [Desulfobacteraceae bacterium]